MLDEPFHSLTLKPSDFQNFKWMEILSYHIYIFINNVNWMRNKLRRYYVHLNVTCVRCVLCTVYLMLLLLLAVGNATVQYFSIQSTNDIHHVLLENAENCTLFHVILSIRFCQMVMFVWICMWSKCGKNAIVREVTCVCDSLILLFLSAIFTRWFGFLFFPVQSNEFNCSTFLYMLLYPYTASECWFLVLRVLFSKFTSFFLSCYGWTQYKLPWYHCTVRHPWSCVYVSNINIISFRNHS